MIVTAAAFWVVAVVAPLGCAETADPQFADVSPPAAVAAQSRSDNAAAPTVKFAHSRASAVALAQLQGHVEAALYLQREGAPGNVASGHLTRGLTHHNVAMNRQFDLMGLDRDLVTQVAQAIERADPTVDLSAPVGALREHFQQLVDTAKGSPLVQIRDLIDRIAALYAAAVEGEAVVAPDTYYEALGYATVAFDRASGVKAEAGDALRNELNALLNLWPDLTRSNDAPASAEAVRNQLNRVRDVLRYAR